MKRSSDNDPESKPGNSQPDASPEENNLAHNDCSKMCSVPIGGARSKVKQHFCNIGNADPVKVNNNNNVPLPNGSSLDTLKFCPLQNGASTSSSSASSPCASKPSDIDCYMRNNVDSRNVVDKCPSKVRSREEGDPRRVDRKWSFADDESSSGNEGDEGMSGDDCCIYTYKGDQFADLPSSFFTLDLIANGLDVAGEAEAPPVREPPVEENERSHAGSSPEMDFLEMDFDPGPSLEQDSEEEYEYDCNVKDEDDVSPVPELPTEPQENDLSAESRELEPMNASSQVENDLGVRASPEPGPSNPRASPPSPQAAPVYAPRTVDSERVCFPARDAWGHHCSSGDLCSPGDPSEIEPGETLALWNAGNMRIQGELAPDTRKYNLHSALYHCIMAKRLIMDKGSSSCIAVVERVGRDITPPIELTMIWSEQEACNKQVTQISTSACGASAVINVMLALNTPVSLERVKEGVATRLRAEAAPLPQYLLSRSNAGATHEDLQRGLQLSSNGNVCTRFFHMYPEREFSLSRWLSYWMKKGAVAIATLNLQHGVAPYNPLPDAWHHQMVFGVGPRGVYLTNPLECVREEALRTQLCSPSVLRIKRSDVLGRWSPATDLRGLMTIGDVRWKRMNVLGQVVNMVRESTNTIIQGRVITSHITIPAAYQSGITLVIPKDAPGCQELLSAPELPEARPC